MQIPSKLAESFNETLNQALFESLKTSGLLTHIEDLASPRFLARSVKPHVERFSLLFNRLSAPEPEKEREKPQDKNAKGNLKRFKTRLSDSAQAEGLKNYWKTSQNRENFLLSYILGFMPGNAIRVGAVWAELRRVGFHFADSFLDPTKPIQAIEFGSGPGSGAVGIGLGEAAAENRLFKNWHWALIEQDRSILQFATEWVERAYREKDLSAQIRPFHRKIEATETGFLPKNAPRFQLFLSSYFLNELSESPEVLADKLVHAWDRHLEEESIIILVEPALKVQSRSLLNLRKALLEKFAKEEKRKKEPSPYHVILPCLGHQACGALAAPEDWCHEEVLWWRPPFLRAIDNLCGLDRKTLPFSYLVIAKSKRSRAELLPNIPEATHRLVSPTHSEGRDLEFYTCGEDGKRKVRYRTEEELARGSILLDAELQGDRAATRLMNRPKFIP
jgi:hypothetical protein